MVSINNVYHAQLQESKKVTNIVGSVQENGRKSAMRLHRCHVAFCCKCARTRQVHTAVKSRIYTSNDSIRRNTPIILRAYGAYSRRPTPIYAVVIAQIYAKYKRSHETSTFTLIFVRILNLNYNLVMNNILATWTFWQSLCEIACKRTRGREMNA